MEQKMKQSYEFNAVIKKDPGSGSAYIEIPPAVRESFGKGRAAVHVLFDGEPYDGNTEKTGTVRIRRDICKKIGRRPGDTVHVTVQERDRESGKVSTAEEYISQFSEDRQKIMQKIRRIILDNIPGAEEKISWGMPSYYLDRFSAGFASAKNHIGFYPGAQPVAEFADRLKEFKTSRGAVQFPLTKPVPYDLIGEICRWISEKAAKKEDAQQRL